VKLDDIYYLMLMCLLVIAAAIGVS